MTNLAKTLSNLPPLTAETDLDFRLYAKYFAFLRRHPTHAARILYGIIVPPHESYMLETHWLGYRENTLVCSRGTSKTFVTGSVFPQIKATLFGNISTLVASASRFRGGKNVLKDSERLVKGQLRNQKLKGNWVAFASNSARIIKREPDMWTIEMKTNSSVFTIPTNNDESVLGLRANILVIDERNTFDGQAIQKTYLPFLNVGTDFENPAQGSEGNQVFFIGTIDYTYRDWYPQIMAHCRLAEIQYTRHKAMMEQDWETYDRIGHEHGRTLADFSLAYTRYDYTDLLIPIYIDKYKIHYPGAVEGKSIKWDNRDNCNPAGSPVLMANWDSKPIEQVKVGDEVVGIEFNEYHEDLSPGVSNKDTRKSLYVKTKVIGIGTRLAPVVKITMKSGRVIRCTPDHKWYSYHPTHINAYRKYKKHDYNTNWMSTKITDNLGNSQEFESQKHAADYLGISKNQVWYCINNKGKSNIHKGFKIEKGKSRKKLKRGDYLEAKIGRRMWYVCDPYVKDPNPKADLGWLAGIFDGEGCVTQQAHHKNNPGARSRRLDIGQSESANPEICVKIGKQLDLLGFRYSYNGKSFIFGGSHWERRNFYHWLTSSIKAQRVLDTLYMSVQLEKDYPVKIESDGKEKVFSLQTETGNYICWGYVSKNCELIFTYPVNKKQLEGDFDKGLVDFETWAAEQRNVFIQASGSVYSPKLIEDATGAIYTIEEEKVRGWNMDEQGRRYTPPVLYKCTDPCILGVDTARTSDFSAFVVIRIGEADPAMFENKGPYELKKDSGLSTWGNVIWAEQHQKMTIKEISDTIRALRARYNIIYIPHVPGITMDARGGGTNVRDELANPMPEKLPNGAVDPAWQCPQKIYDPKDDEYEHLSLDESNWPGLELLWTSDQINQELVGFSRAQMEVSRLYIGQYLTPTLRDDPDNLLAIGYRSVQTLKNQLLRIQANPTASGKSIRYQMPGDPKKLENKKDLFSAFLYACHGLRKYTIEYAQQEGGDAPVAYGIIIRQQGQHI